jgi:mRNA interferase MazF
VRRGDLYRTDTTEPERGQEPGYYLIVSRDFVAEHDRIETVVCAAVYSEVLGIPTEVIVEASQGVRHTSAVRCDFLMLMFKRRLTRYVSTLPPDKMRELDRALAVALDLPIP